MKHIIILALTVIFMGSCTKEPIEIPVEDTFYTLTDNLIEECCQCLNWHGYKVSAKQYSHTYQNACR